MFYRPSIVIKTVKESVLNNILVYHYACERQLKNNDNCIKCRKRNECDRYSREFMSFLENNYRCACCHVPLSSFYMLLIFRCKDYLPNNFIPLCCVCYNKERKQCISQT